MIDFRRVRAQCAEQLAHAHATGDLALEARMHRALGQLERQEHNFGASLEHLLAEQRILETHFTSSHDLRAANLFEQGQILLARGLLLQADALFGAVLEQAERQSDRSWHGRALFGLGLTATSRGADDEALTRFAASRLEFEAAGDAEAVAELDVLVHRMRGELQPGEANDPNGAQS